ncbi:hypothetical protein SETIT_6G194200v2 [Setaria italica]|uniref:Thioredoxin domain-containing protein n=1 Tax=Setaria italica TaxID=4555 RepID=K3YLQ6_SETIT|nr:hypothetical protein SETIT_6G194200v2 [Setaria italica]
MDVLGEHCTATASASDSAEPLHDFQFICEALARSLSSRAMQSYQVEHLHSAEAVDDAINREGESGRLVVVRFGRGGHGDCVRFDDALAAAAERVGPGVAAMYAVDIEEVRDFNAMYELTEPCTVMFFYGYRHVNVRGLRGRDGIDWAACTGGEFAGLVLAVHERAKAGRRLVIVD